MASSYGGSRNILRAKLRRRRFARERIDVRRSDAASRGSWFLPPRRRHGRHSLFFYFFLSFRSRAFLVDSRLQEKVRGLLDRRPERDFSISVVLFRSRVSLERSRLGALPFYHPSSGPEVVITEGNKRSVLSRRTNGGARPSGKWKI